MPGMGPGATLSGYRTQGAPGCHRCRTPVTTDGATLSDDGEWLCHACRAHREARAATGLITARAADAPRTLVLAALVAGALALLYSIVLVALCTYGE